MCVKDADHFQIQVALLKMRCFNGQMSVEIENPIFQLLNGGIYTKTSYAKLWSLMAV